VVNYPFNFSSDNFISVKLLKRETEKVRLGVMHADWVRIRQPVTLRCFHRFKEDSAVAGEGTQEQSNRRGKSHTHTE